MIEVSVEFHGPFRVAEGTAGDGVDEVARDGIPASSLKGVMRAAAAYRLALPAVVVDRIFGTVATASPWAWTDLRLREPIVTTRTRVPLDPVTRTAVRGGLLVAQEVWSASAESFSVEWCGAADDEHLGDAHVLAGIAMSVKSLGASRRRGLGWVSLRPSVAGTPLSPTDAAAAIDRARRGEGS